MNNFDGEVKLTSRSRLNLYNLFLHDALNPRGLRILKAIDQVAKTYNSTPTQVSLAWLIANPTITAPIVSATKVEQLNDIIKAVNINLDQDAIDLLNQASCSNS
ncbi:MAG: aldo/keto reductase [Nostoc sp.]|uniref:aldo/keto reductase n=1 Tax=Nostoc sp. TaxID=1180 RepID=UPI002FF75B30